MRPSGQIHRSGGDCGAADEDRRQSAVFDLRQQTSRERDDATAHYNRGTTLLALGQFEAALTSLDRAIAMAPADAEAYNNRGNALEGLKQFEAAVASYDRAIALAPDYAGAYSNRGNALQELGRFEAALASYDAAIAIAPDFAEAHSNRGNALQALRQSDAALASYRTAIAIKPDYAEAHTNRGNVLLALWQVEAAVASYDTAIALKPNDADAYTHRGMALHELRRFDEALASFDAAVAIEPESAYIRGLRLNTAMHMCAWGDDERPAQMAALVQASEKALPPFPLLALCGSPSLQRHAAERWVRERCPARGALPPIAKRTRGDRIRLGYFSADFQHHATSHLLAGVFEAHDRTAFEVAAFSFGPDTNDEMRQRLMPAFDRFIDVRHQSDHEVAQLARRLEIDIAVDLKGFTANARTGIFAARAAPLQVGYLGYPGTMGADYIDYLITDRTIIPELEQEHYAEQLAYLPNSYQANDATRSVSDAVVTREAMGLPDSGVVFCCFNNNYKITSAVFDSWMRILRQVPGSVLWLLEDNASAARNLANEAHGRGMDPRRLVFAKRVPPAEQLARHRLADLFLDTLPCNAHTTASDALWAGVPVVTRIGDTFAGRVAASLLTAIGLPELITTSQEQYEALAVELSTNPERLRQLKEKLAGNRLTTPLFDTALLTRHLEAAYTQMVERYQAGLPPAHIDITS